MPLPISEFSTHLILDELFLAIFLVPDIEKAIWNSTKKYKYNLLLHIIRGRRISSSMTIIPIVHIVPICKFISAEYPQVVLGFIAAIRGISKTEMMPWDKAARGGFLILKRRLQEEGFGNFGVKK